MTFPSGAPGGFPGQGPQQPPQGPGYGPPRAGLKLGLPQILHLGTAALGVIIFFVAFASIADVPDGADGISFYKFDVGLGWIPLLMFVGGILSLKAILPGEDKKPGLVPPVLIFGTTWAYLFMVFSLEGNQDMGAGGIMVMIFAIMQMLVSIGAYLLDSGIIKMPQPNPYGHQGGFPQTGTFQQQPPSAGFPQQQPQSGSFPQQPPAQPGQQTTFAPQQGQFGQQQPPGTPPGGYPQG
jgi:uncharacterized protein DUF5336